MNQTSSLHGMVVLSFESRRSEAMAALIRHHGGTPMLAPSMRELPLGENPILLEFLRRLEAGRLDVVVLLTGSGTRALAAHLSATCAVARLAELLRSVIVVARGPKPVRALRELGLRPTVEAAEPNTWREVLDALDAYGSIAGLHVAIQEYGRPNPELMDGLRQRGAEVFQVPVYRWTLPEDREPLEHAIRELANGHVDVILFTSARQMDHVLQVADTMELREPLLRACGSVVVGSVGPVCSSALRSHGLQVDIEPAHPKMGHLLRGLADQASQLVARKRSLDRPVRLT